MAGLHHLALSVHANGSIQKHCAAYAGDVPANAAQPLEARTQDPSNADAQAAVAASKPGAAKPGLVLENDPLKALNAK